MTDQPMEEDANIDREQQLRAQLLQQREQRLRAQREEQLRAQLLQQREEQLRAKLLEIMANRARNQDQRGEGIPRGGGDMPVAQPVVHQPAEQEMLIPDTQYEELAPQDQGDDQDMGLEPETPALLSWTQMGDEYQSLNPADNSYQVITTNSGNYVWHPADPSVLMQQGTFKMYRTDGAQGQYKNACFIKHDHDLQYGDEFCLIPIPQGGRNGVVYDVGAYADVDWNADLPPGYIYVPWGHIAEHLYGYTTMDDKDSHSFFRPGTTEDDLLQYLVDALNSGQDKIEVDGVDAGIKWASPGVIKTFYRWLEDGHPDKYTSDEIVFVKENRV